MASTKDAKLLAELVKLIWEVANRVSDKHVLAWHRGFNKRGIKVQRGTKFHKCSCLSGSIRDILMELEE